MTKKSSMVSQLGNAQSGTVPRCPCEGIRVSSLPLKDTTSALSVPNVLDAGEPLWHCFQDPVPISPSWEAPEITWYSLRGVPKPRPAPSLICVQQQDVVGNVSPSKETLLTDGIVLLFTELAGFPFLSGLETVLMAAWWSAQQITTCEAVRGRLSSAD